MKKVFVLSAALVCSMMVSLSAWAEEGEKKVEFEVGADVVSAYVWRGQDCGGFSVQPAATVTWTKPGISLGAWASAELFESSSVANMTEFDLSLSWSPTEALSVGLTDYYFYDSYYLRRWDFSGESSHNLELNLSYDFGFMQLAWNTCLTGYDYNSKGDRAYSSYFEASVPFAIGGVDCSAALGIVPWEDCFNTGGFNEGFNVTNIALTANKDIKGLPFMGQVVYNPQLETTYFVVGLSF